MKRHKLLTTFIISACALTAYAGLPGKVSQRGWAPLVALTGKPDAQAAVPTIRKGANTVGVVLHGLDVDKPTREFISTVRDSLASFDLEGFYEMLPNKQGTWRRMQITGRRDGVKYRVRKTKRRVAFGPEQKLGATLGDLRGELRSKPVPVKGERTNYLLQAELGLGVGNLAWGEVTGMLSGWASLATSGDVRGANAIKDMSQRAGRATRLKLLKVRPRLRHEDIEVLGILWESFPKLGDLLYSISRIEDVMVFDPKGKGSGYKQLRLAARLRPDLMKADYEELAEFLEGLGPLINMQIAFVDEAGRQIARCSFDTQRLRFVLDCFVKDGQLVPVGKDGKVLSFVPRYPAGAVRRIRGYSTVRFNMNGIRLTMHNLRMDWSYDQRPRRMDLTCQIKRVPKVSISGRAFGILPTWAIDVVIPGNMDELLREFMTTATKGNGGKGIFLALRARQAKNGRSTLKVEGGLEILNSLLVRIAARIASQKLLPDADVRSDIHKLLVRIHAAFLHDLNRYGRLAKQAHKPAKK